MMDPSSAVQQPGVEHVLHGSHHADLNNVDPHNMGVLSMSNSVHNHMLAPQLGGYLHSQHSLPMPPSPAVHIVPNNVSQVSLSNSPYVHPGLMQEQTEKYGPLLFHKDDQGLYTCFFTGCGKKLKANFSRHVAKHEMDGDKMDPNLATQIQTSSASKNLGTTKICSHPTHQEWWGTSSEQPVTEFYKRCSKCKKCYIRLQQESKRQRLSIENLNNTSPVAPPVNFGQPYGGEMFPLHVNNMPMMDQYHIKRDAGVDEDHGPPKRMRIEDSHALMAHLEALSDKHFKEMAELTARHSANSRKLIAQNTNIRMQAELRHTKEKEELEVKLRNEWDQFRINCLKEREELYQAQMLALQRELNSNNIPARPCRLCSKRTYTAFLYQCNLCNEEACIRCQAVMVCGVCGTKSCENCTIKHNWLIWCNRCHKTFCTHHRSISDDICPNCEHKGVDMMMHHQPLQLAHLQHHDLEHQSPHLHHPHQDLDPYSSHHHSNHPELLGQHLKFEELDHDDHPQHPHSHHQYSHEPQMHSGHMGHHLPHDLHHHHHHHMQHMHSGHEHLQHDLQHDHHHYQEYDNMHQMPSDLDHHQQYEQQNYQEQHYHHTQQNGQSNNLDQQQDNYQEQNHYEQQNQIPGQQDLQGTIGDQNDLGQQNSEEGILGGQQEEQALQQGDQQQDNDQYDQDDEDSNSQSSSSNDNEQLKYDIEPPPQQPIQ